MRFVVLGAVAFALAAPAVGAQGKPSLRVMKSLPMTIRGTDFRPGEGVAVTVVMGPRRFTQSTHAGTGGAFSVHWNGVRLNWCSMPLRIDARGSKPGKVAAKIPIAQCPPS